MCNGLPSSRRVVLAAAASCSLLAGAPVPAEAGRRVPEVFDLTADRAETGGAWCWFQDERAVVDEDAPGGRSCWRRPSASGPKAPPAAA